MAKIARRTLLKSSAAAAALAGAPSLARAQAHSSAARSIRAVFHGDVPTYDPIWTTANMAAYHGGMVYDTLFGIDDKGEAKPQMVNRYGYDAGNMTWTFELRPGLKWHDGTDVTSADIVSSIRRWAARDGGGQHMMERVRGIEAKDEKTFTIQLKERYGLVLDVLSKTSTPVCFMMRKREAETDPMQKIETVVGSGPFTLNLTETRPGTQYVYDRNPNYVPRAEAPSGISGGKVVKVDRVTFVNMPDGQTAVAALQAGEIDFYEIPQPDFMPQLESDRNIRIQVLNQLGQVGLIRPNFLHPPFDNVKARQALLHCVKQSDHMRATFGTSQYAKDSPSYFAMGTPMSNDANTGWYTGGQNFARSRALLAEMGYRGEEVLLMQATNIPYMSNSAQLLAQELRQGGFNVRLVAMDWSNVVQRRSVKAPPAQGGWNLFITSAGGTAVGHPILLAAHAATGDRGWFGWPQDEKHEQLRAQWAVGETLAERQRIAREIQTNAWNFVPQVYYGQWIQPAAMRSNIRNMLPVAEIIPWWNVEKG
ncbi:MAG: ABC transporter substrate-binding protein [Alphaproteobacteria bacterium]|nr:ABC transporter substrate-binding protein [Alphaproteobacteria bacterium]